MNRTFARTVVVCGMMCCGSSLSFAQHKTNDYLFGSPGKVFGLDKRVKSTDLRVGRLLNNGVCTAFLTSLGVALTAAHCGRPSADTRLQFSVPPSSRTGEPTDPDHAFEFPVRLVAVGNEHQAGEDWQVLSIGRNGRGENVYDVAGGFFRLQQNQPPTQSIVAVTGYGIDDQPAGPEPICGRDDLRRCNAQSLTEQTDAGPVVDTNANWITYRVDTDGGASGGPVILPGSGVAVAIHHGGWDGVCGPQPPRDPPANCGTAFNDPALETALQTAYNSGGRTVFIDGETNVTNPTGGVYKPFRRLSDAIAKVCANNQCPSDLVTFYVVKGRYEGLGFKTPPGANFRFLAPAGKATIGPAVPPQGL